MTVTKPMWLMGDQNYVAFIFCDNSYFCCLIIVFFKSVSIILWYCLAEICDHISVIICVIMAKICELTALFIDCAGHAAACSCCWTGAEALQQRAQGLRTATAASPGAVGGGTEGINKFFQSMFNKGYFGHWEILLGAVTGKVHGGGWEGMKFVNWWLPRKMKFFSVMQGTCNFYNGSQEILSKPTGTPMSSSLVCTCRIEIK